MLDLMMLTDLIQGEQVTKGGKREHTHTRTNTHIPVGLVKRLLAFHQVFPFQTGLRARSFEKLRSPPPAFGYGLIFKLGARWTESECYQSSLY